MYGAIAIVGQVEVVAAIALGPAIINSFLFLSSMKRIVEHREIKAKPVSLTEDFKLKATSDKDASVTLVRLILAGGRPLTEKEIGYDIFRLTIFSGILAIITAFMMEISL
jgi:UDP-N-acetylglucosamine--dolichyl-phosphate N-acetylglucosaminephosphotransferase